MHTAFQKFATIPLVLALAATALGDEFRSWTAGKVSIKAKFVSTEGGNVVLEKEDGDEVEVELKKLSAADQKYVADKAKEKDDESPFKPKKDDPFKPKSKNTAKAGAMKGDAGEARTLSANWSGVRMITPAPVGNVWSVTVGEAPDPSKVVKTRPIPVAPKTNFFEKVEGLVVSADGKKAAIGYVTDEPRPDGVTRIVVLDLENAQPYGWASNPGKMAPLAMNDDGSQVLMKSNEFGFGKQDRLELWTLTESGIKKNLSFEPYNAAQGPDRDIKWAAFLNEKKIATVSGKGALAVWELGKPKPLYAMNLAGGTIPAISPDRKLLAFATDKEVGVLDVAEGTVLGLQGRPQMPWPVLAFSPSGKRLALAAVDKLWACDTATGAPFCQMLLTGINLGGKLQFTGEDHVLAGGQYLLDLAQEVKVWNYEPQPGNLPITASDGNLCLFYVPNGTDHPGALIPSPIPHPAAKLVLDKIATNPAFFVLKPGTTVKLDVSGVADNAQRARVAEALTARLSANGCQVGPGGTIDLVAATETGKVQDRTYHSFGRMGNQTYKVQEYFSRVKFVYQGQVVWESGGSNIPGAVSLKQGETMESYLRDHEKPNYDFFTSIELPGKLGKPPLAKSSVSTSGIR